MNNEHPTDPIGTIEWTERTGGVLTARECVSLAGPLMRDELRMFGGLLALALRLHSGRRSVVDPASLAPPDSSLARDAEEGGPGSPVACPAQPLAPRLHETYRELDGRRFIDAAAKAKPIF
jgi:hypothetical protein